jgi:hypothetical protein
MNAQHFTLWSALVSITACGLLLASATTANPLALLLYYVVILASIRFIHFRTLHPVLRVVLLSAFTPPILLLATAFVSPRLDDVASLSIPITLFFVTYAIVAMVERSLLVNLVVVPLFWIAVSVFAVLETGTEPEPWGETVSFLLNISLFACVHAIIQLGMAAFAEPRELW